MEENLISSSDIVNNPKNTFKIKSFLKFFIYLFLLVFFCLFIFNFFFLKAPKDFPSDSIQEIEIGSSLRSISADFKRLNLIKSRVAFETFLIFYGDERHIIPGDYFFEKKLKANQLAKRIADGDKQLAPLKITIPEGYTISQMALVFSKKLPHFNSENFLNNAKEGYLFPDTYFFSIETTEDGVIKLMSDNFNKKVLPLLPATYPGGKDLSQIEKDIITMASIIEREAKGDQDREYISGILWNRLRINMALQVDAAPLTYKKRGLPDSPIASPGLEAIKAAIYPKVSNYLYYLHAKDGQIYFAKTFAEHKANKVRYLK